MTVTSEVVERWFTVINYCHTATPFQDPLLDNLTYMTNFSKRGVGGGGERRYFSVIG